MWTLPEALDLEKGKAGKVSRNFQRSTCSVVKMQWIRSIREAPQSQSCFRLRAKSGWLYVKNVLDLDRSIRGWIFFMLCGIATFVYPLIFYLPVINSEKRCLGSDTKLAKSLLSLHLLISGFYITGCFVADGWRQHDHLLSPIRDLRYHFEIMGLKYIFLAVVDFMLFHPIPISIWISAMLVLFTNPTTMGNWTFLIPLCYFVFEYLLKVIRISIMFTKATVTYTTLAQAKWDKALFNLLLYIHGGHVFGALWYNFAIHREVACWKEACLSHNGCNPRSFSCKDISGDRKFLNVSCSTMTQDKISYDFGIFHYALQSGVVEITNFPEKVLYCFRWGLHSLSSFGRNLQPSTFAGENIFVISITIYGVVLFVLLIRNIQTHLQFETIRSGKMRLLGPETEQWISFRNLSENLLMEIKKYQLYSYLGTERVDLGGLFNNLPKDLRKNIKLELCLELLRKVQEFGKLRESSLEDLCGRLQPVRFVECTCVVQEGDPIVMMLFVVKGKLWTYSSRIIRNGSPRNNYYLKDGDFYGKELITWFQADSCPSNLPISTRTIQAVTNVEAFALIAEDLQNLFIIKHHAARFIQKYWKYKKFFRC